MEKKTDRRIIRTKKRIHDTFLELFMEKDLSQITVKELSERADINRKTFYSYYSNMEELFASIQDEISERFLSKIREYDITSPEVDTMKLFSSLNDVIFQDYGLYQRLYQTKQLAPFVEHIRQVIIGLFTDIYAAELRISRNEYLLYVEYFISGILAMYTKWFSLEPEMPLDELTRIAGYASFHGFHAIRDHLAKAYSDGTGQSGNVNC